MVYFSGRRIASPTPFSGPWLTQHGPELIALCAFALVLWQRALLNDSDTWWHLSAGDWILAHGAVPRSDPFSYTFGGQPWIPLEWLAEVMLSLAWRAAGWPGVVLLTAGAFGLAVWLLARAAGRSLRGLPLWLTMLGGLVLFAPHLLARPHILVLPLMVVWFAGLVAARRECRLPSPWLLAVMVVWANMHGSFIAGLGLVVPFALEAVLQDPRGRTLLGWFAFSAAAVLAAMCTPFGLDGFLLPLRLVTTSQIQHIGEWGPVALDRLEPLHIAVLAFAVFYVLRRPRLGWLRWAVLLLLLAMSLTTQRHEMLLGLLGVLLLAEPIAAAIGPDGASTPSRNAWPLAVPAVILAAARLAIPIAEPVNERDPREALAHVPPALAARHVFNAYRFGGYLIRAGVAPFVDSRAELYGGDFLEDYSELRAASADDLAGALDRYDVAWTIFPPNTPVATAMETMPGWRRLYADAIAVIHVRQ